MANKPVSGALGYNSTADRPTVQLKSGVKRLLTEDDATGGSVAEITSTGGTVTITDPFGPVVNLEVVTAVDDVTGTGAINVSPTTGNVVVSLDESELENGGSQELSVAGLSGVLADPQIAGSLDTTGAAVDVSAAAPGTAGQLLTLTDATHATWQSPAPAASLDTTGSAVDVSAAAPGVAGNVLTLTDATHAIWQVPVVGDNPKDYFSSDGSYAVDDDFTAGSLAAAWNVQQYNTSTVLTLDGTVDTTVVPAANHYRLSPNYRNTWCLLQAAPATDVFFYRTLAWAAAGQVRIRFRWKAPYSATGGVVRFYIGRESSGHIDNNNYLQIGWELSTGSAGTLIFHQGGRQGGAFNGTVDSASLVGKSVAGELVISWSGGTAGSVEPQNNQCHLITDAGVQSFPFLTQCLGTSGNLYIGLRMSALTVTGTWDTGNLSKFVAIDYYRQKANGVVLPV